MSFGVRVFYFGVNCWEIVYFQGNGPFSNGCLFLGRHAVGQMGFPLMMLMTVGEWCTKYPELTRMKDSDTVSGNSCSW